jgi:hypothetical protein
MKMMGEIRIEVPEDVKRLIEENPELKEAITREIINKIIYAKIAEGSISKDLLNIATGVKDVILENEEAVLKELRDKARERVK